MSIFLNLGMTDHPARHIKRRPRDQAPELGTLNEGSPADIAVLEVQEGKFGFMDSGHARLDATRRLRCLLTVRDGAIV